MPNDARIEELSQDAAARIKCASTTSEWLIVIEEALRTAIREARDEQIRKDADIAYPDECTPSGPCGRIQHNARLRILDQLPTKKG